jgi:arylsulfatase A-like enzyme
VLHTWATEEDDPTEHPRWGRVGKQRIEDTGPLTKKRMETCDTEFVAAAQDFIKRAHDDEQPFFVWFNTTWMHFRVHPPEHTRGPGRALAVLLPRRDGGARQARGADARPAGRAGHRRGHHRHVLDRQRPAHEHLARRRHDPLPQREELQLGRRVPRAGVVRWPGKIPAGVVSNEIISHTDWLPTLLAAAGEPEINEKLKQGHQAGDKQFKVHIDGYNFLPYLTGETKKGPRQGIIYFSDDGDLVGLRYDNWKFVFAEQRVQGTVMIWAEPFVFLRVPKIFNLRTDPFERADITSNTYWDWMIDRVYLTYAAQFHRARVPGDLQRVPAAHEACQLHRRRRAEEDGAGFSSSAC